MRLIEVMNSRRINTIYWVPSAMAIISNWDVFSYGRPEYLEKVLFAGETMPVKHLNYWMKALPGLPVRQSLRPDGDNGYMHLLHN